ncbi:DUF2300 domain-containing protein [Paraburkholderia terricola]|uniref:DUF2300 domain-containing protein YfaQ n=1 Tax=Paraburkholderia terricola TaxID=169427 RepID=A0A1M6WUR4_9BURK|nr:MULTISPECIES: DUF2300 domain-containing protein [Paraburkholderia]AXE95549.1 DUF2300 domain-containing protein [Paraburkholderia terricola]SDP21984.1 DUF2300 domain-containing protein YfaQ [Paraburkholderia sediminicola]SHK97319.1 DUF2300 domain-containing protein YfaQ [Paraburkholderia terricola]
MFSALRHTRDRLAAVLRIALALSVGCACVDGVKAYAAASSVETPVVASARRLRFAWLRDGESQLWQVDAGSAGVAVSAQSARPLPATLETPLGSVWKLFVYGYLVDRNIATPDYTCSGGDPEEAYCCMTGGRIDREHALVQSCGRFFEPARLQLDAADWRKYWTAAHAPAWLRNLHAMTPTQRVPVIDLLAALQAMPARPREAAASTLVSVLTSGRGEGTVSLYGSVLRAKTWTMPDPARPGASIGGAAGWLVDGTPVWLGGPGGSARVLAAAAPRIAPLLTQVTVPDDGACVLVDFFSRYPIREVLGDRGPAAAPDGPLRGEFRVGFVNGNWARVQSRGELRLDRSATGAPQIVGRFGMNDYVARVVEREGDTSQPEAAKALAVAARTYVVQHGSHDHGCLRIDDSSGTQRVLPRAPGAAARRAADLTDALVLTGVPVQYHHDKAAAGQMSWLAAKASAQGGLTFDAILARTWPQATLTAFQSPLSGDCIAVAGAQQWLRRNAPSWARRMDGAAGYETPDLPAVCAVREGRPYADAQRNRVYVYRLQTEEDRIALAHEYVHLAFQHHPRGVDETFVERTARTLIRTDNPIQ